MALDFYLLRVGFGSKIENGKRFKIVAKGDAL